ncbi:SDR family NAD(P)-dependent oxidoreductase [Lichenifustis flavocetrariae]|uniref:SDR family oxidoreductase n=1 Tax=Lichenifustis flavocetrariae TaxID=2949735 RepID=A0AA41Z3X3_9HYPH|nr:SDR family oxidoreductase [Lichenifustis flavocetrariae]MCW6510028.1 SDR family oxidoreductase [Lichenifustis flavocetrariae]
MKTDRIVVITGAAGGMGKLAVERFLANGDTVVATDTSDKALKLLVDSQEPEAKLHTVVGDISKEEDCGRVAALASDVGGRVDVLVNVAGFFPMQTFDEMTADDFRKVVDINLTGTFLMIKAMAPLLRGRGWGRIVNIGSASVFEGVADQVHYVAAKSGLFGLSRSLARVFGKDGITVNVVTPGLTVTPAVKANMPPELIDQQIKLRALPREETGHDLIGAIFFLASPDADFISGQTVNVDGGKHML